MVAADAPAVAEEIDGTSEPDAPEPEQQGTEAAEEQAPTGRRAARQRAQEAEERATLAEQRLAAAQRRDVERIAATTLAQPGDVLDAALGGVELADLVDGDGIVDPELVRAAVEAVTTARPGLAAVPAAPRVGQHYDAGVRTPVARGRTWVDVLRGRP